MENGQQAATKQDVVEAVTALLAAQRPVIHAGQGVLYAQGTGELVELAELLQIPVMTTLEGKSAFPEDHALALGSASGVMSRPAFHFLTESDTRMYEEGTPYIDALAEAQRMFAGINKDKNKWAYVFAPESDFIGLRESSLPSFWAPALSKAY